MLGGLWEFPGGKRKGRESLKETVLRETKEETTLSIAVRKKYCQVKHAYTHFKITLTAFKCDCLSGTAQPLASDDVKWVSLEKIDRFPFPKANIEVIKAIKEDEVVQDLEASSERISRKEKKWPAKQKRLKLKKGRSINYAPAVQAG